MRPAIPGCVPIGTACNLFPFILGPSQPGNAAMTLFMTFAFITILAIGTLPLPSVVRRFIHR
jgi:hypothetical protein